MSVNKNVTVLLGTGMAGLPIAHVVRTLVATKFAGMTCFSCRMGWKVTLVQETLASRQIGRGDVPQDLRHALTVAITPAPGGEEGIAVTLGQQQWLTPKMASFAAVMGLIAVLVTPWALFALLWPVSEMAGSSTLPGDIWNTIDTYVASCGGTLAQTEELTHPHAH